jgi:hypothetical protein
VIYFVVFFIGLARETSCVWRAAAPEKPSPTVFFAAGPKTAELANELG